MKKGCSGFMLLVYACVVALVGAIVDQAPAAQKKNKEQSQPSAAKQSHKPSPGQARNRTKIHTKKATAPIGSKQQSEVLRKQAEQDPAVSKAPRRKGSHSVRARKKTRPRAKVQPRTDLMYHGLLEDSRRYDPRPNYRTAGVQNPHARYLTQDHFQELDHNQDGKIDPIERAFGRLDIDRDLHNRQPY
jgi:C-terminal processing protease CtpA/Prc